MPETFSHDIQRLSDYFKLMSDPGRLKIILFLTERELCVCELSELLSASQPAVSRNLKRLKEAGVIKSRRQDQWIFYSLNNSGEHLPLIEKIIDEMPSVKEDIKYLLPPADAALCENKPISVTFKEKV